MLSAPATRRDGLRARRARRRRLAPQHLSRAPPATSRRTCTSSRSRPNPHWSRRYAPQAEIQAYLEDVARALRRARPDPHRHRGRRARAGTRSAAGGCWRRAPAPHEADVLLTACGQLSVPTVPPIPGLDSFAGPAFHTARWRHDVDLAGKRVAVVGTGCSAIQVVPAIQPIVEQRRRLPALARLDDPEDGLRLQASAPSGCSSASRSCSGSTARRSSPSWSSAPRR